MLKHIIFANFVVSSSSGLLCGGIAHKFGLEQWLFYGAFGFFATMAVYNGQRLFKTAVGTQTEWLKWVNSNQQSLLLLTFVSFLCSVSALLSLNTFRIMPLVLLGVSGVISVFYVIKIKGRNMREIPYLKIHLIALSWVAVIIVFPMYNEAVESDLLWYALAHYLYFVAITIPFDIRDLKYDARTHRTIPQLLGIKASKWLAVTLLIGFGAIMFLIDASLLRNPMFYLALVAQLILVGFMTEERTDIYCAAFIDGAIALLGISYFLV